MPNMFTPNGDGCNDLLRLHHDSVVVENFSIKIKNTGDIKMFESTDPNFEWDGRSRNNGNVCKLDVYKYEMSFDAHNRHYHVKKTIVIDWMGDKYHKPTNACPAQFDNCAFDSQWDGVQFNPALPNNEYFTCN